MVVFACCVFGLLHALLFGLHTFILFRHASLYEQIRAQGATIQMPDTFHSVYEQAQTRSFFSRPDILAREIGAIQSATSSMVYQYQHDIYRLQDTIVQHIKYLAEASDLSQELVYPEQEKSAEYAVTLQKRLDLIPMGSINDLLKLSQESASLVATVQNNIEYAERKLVLQDIVALKHEMLLLQDMYRLYPQKDVHFVVKDFWADFKHTFTRDTLKKAPIESLRGSLQ